MKNKNISPINMSSIIVENSKNYFKLISDDTPLPEEKKTSSNKAKNTHNNNRKQKSRQINSLDELTKKFIKCASESGSNIINLNTIMKKMRVKKRRIYDITNVLEGKLII
jgi:hypothetical protein